MPAKKGSHAAPVKSVDSKEKAEAEVRKIEADARKEVENNKKKGVVPPAALEVPLEEKLNDLKLRLTRVRNLTGPAFEALDTGNIPQAKVCCAEVVQWAKLLDETLKTM